MTADRSLSSASGGGGEKTRTCRGGSVTKMFLNKINHGTQLRRIGATINSIMPINRESRADAGWRDSGRRLCSLKMDRSAVNARRYPSSAAAIVARLGQIIRQMAPLKRRQSPAQRLSPLSESLWSRKGRSRAPFRAVWASFCVLIYETRVTTYLLARQNALSRRHNTR